jgi:hypothetical protein
MLVLSTVGFRAVLFNLRQQPLRAVGNVPIADVRRCAKRSFSGAI